MTDQTALTLGIDIGTQGARVIAVDSEGRVEALARQHWELQGDEHDTREQDPEMWWKAVVACVGEVVSTVGDASRIAGLSVAATSGTLVLADEHMVPVRPAMMWNDKRARHEATQAGEILGCNGLRPTFTLPKALWVRRHQARAWRRTKHLLSAGDWLLARFTQGEPVTDYTNALKTGLDLHNLVWPESLTDLGVDLALLPRVVAPGTTIGVVGPEVVADMGLDRRTAVVAGATDATAAQIAAGVADEGQWVTTIGTGLSIKGVSAAELKDHSGALYSHRHWSMGWIPTGTSHCGADSLASRFAQDELEVLAERCDRPVSAVLVLPLTTVGEFFPFWAPQARGFEVGAPRDRADLLRGYLEGIGFVERLGMERMLDAGAASAGPQVTMGGGAGNDEWMRIRAAILNRPTVRPLETSSAFGAAVIAASSPEGISAAAHRMVRYLDIFEPDAATSRRYDDRYSDFLDELRLRGYLQETLR